MASLAFTDDAFRRVYCLHLVVSLLWTHPALAKYTRYSFARTRYGHWYHPLEAEKHSTFFRLFRVPHGNPLQFTLLFSIVLCSLGIMVCANTASPITRAASYVAWGSSLLYFARVRTHGLVHKRQIQFHGCWPFFAGCRTDNAPVPANCSCRLRMRPAAF